MMRLMLSVLVVGFTCALQAADPSAVEKILKDPDFYEKGFNTAWTEGQAREMISLMRSAKDPLIRFRAQIVMVGLYGRARIADASQRELASIALRHLENHLNDESLQDLLRARVTNYTVSTKPNGLFFLIESICDIDPETGTPTTRGVGGGLNVRFDPDKKAILDTTVWGNLSLLRNRE